MEPFGAGDEHCAAIGHRTRRRCLAVHHWGMGPTRNPKAQRLCRKSAVCETGYFGRPTWRLPRHHQLARRCRFTGAAGSCARAKHPLPLIAECAVHRFPKTRRAHVGAHKRKASVASASCTEIKIGARGRRMCTLIDETRSFEIVRGVPVTQGVRRVAAAH